MKFLNYDSRKFFLLGARIFFGIWLLYAGVYKWVAIGPATLVGYITSEFANFWPPHTLIVILSWVILITEIVLPLWILSGKLPRLAWSLTTLFMFMLVIGQSILMKPEVYANWFYLMFTLVCAALSDPHSTKSETAQA